jgi:hypothetical protein
MNEQYIKAVTQTGRPIPGQSLTSNPDNPAPYEKPPEFTSVHAASEFIFSKLIEEETYVQTMGLLLDDMPIMDITQTILFSGFTEGKWNPDLMLMLVEPIAYMLLALAERADIEPVLYRDEEQDDEEEEKVLGTSYERKKLQTMKNLLRQNNATATTITPEMMQQIESLPEVNQESLMANQEQVESPVAAESLMAMPPKEELQ